MPVHGHTTTWGAHIGLGRARDAKGWYEHLQAWWAAHKAMRDEARLATFRARGDATRETLKPCRAEAAADMVAAKHAFSTATALGDLGS